MTTLSLWKNEKFCGKNVSVKNDIQTFYFNKCFCMPEPIKNLQINIYFKSQRINPTEFVVRWQLWFSQNVIRDRNYWSIQQIVPVNLYQISFNWKIHRKININFWICVCAKVVHVNRKKAITRSTLNMTGHGNPLAFQIFVIGHF